MKTHRHPHHRTPARIVALLLLLGLTNPLAHAQAAQPAPPGQPDLFQETLKAQRTSDRSQGFYATEAVVVNVVRVPGKVVRRG